MTHDKTPLHPLADPLTDFEAMAYTFDRVTKTVWVSGEGPAVIVLAEMPGISPDVARFSRWIRDAGFSVYLPSLFGRDGEFPQAEAGVEVLKAACISAEFRAFASDSPAPVTAWLRSLARAAHNERGGSGVGAIGMCFTGNFALSMTLESAVIAPVLCQPSLPFDDSAGINMTTQELASVRARIARDDLSVLGFRFSGDRHCRAERFAAYQAALGDRFLGRVLDDSAANPAPPPFFSDVVASPHSVVTAHLIDRAGEPTIAARDEIIAFLTRRLAVTA